MLSWHWWLDDNSSPSLVSGAERTGFRFVGVAGKRVMKVFSAD